MTDISGAEHSGFGGSSARFGERRERRQVLGNEKSLTEAFGQVLLLNIQMCSLSKSDRVRVFMTE